MTVCTYDRPTHPDTSVVSCNSVDVGGVTLPKAIETALPGELFTVNMNAVTLIVSFVNTLDAGDEATVDTTVAGWTPVDPV